MIKFILNLITFSVILLTIYTINSNRIFNYLKDKTPVLGSEVYVAIDRSLSPNSKTRIIFLGDSVARQLFESLNSTENITSLASNQAIAMIGQYLLLSNYMSKSHSVKELYLVYTPYSLSNDLDQIYTYNYFLKPFNSSYYSARFTPYAQNQIDKIPYSKMSKFYVIKLSKFSPKYTPEKSGDYVLSTITIEYLDQIKKLTDERNIKFTILSAPIKESQREKIKKLIIKYKMSSFKSKYMNKYFDNITFLPDYYYRDNIHFKKEYIDDVRKRVMLKLSKNKTLD